jgi:hypothetical protein
LTHIQIISASRTASSKDGKSESAHGDCGQCNISDESHSQPPPPPTSLPGFPAYPSATSPIEITTIPKLGDSGDPNPDIDIEAVALENGGDDRYAGLMEDGLGNEDDMQDDDGPASDANKDPGMEYAGAEDGSDNSRRPQRRPLPDWLMAEFQLKVKDSNNRDAQGLPPLYRDSQTFWFPRAAPFFVLRKFRVSPQELMLPRFFLWDPAALCTNGIGCPTCGKKLNRDGHVGLPRRCVDLDGSFWIIGYRYRCPSCKNGKALVFRSWDSRILNKLPKALAAEFPAHLTYRSGLSHSLFKLMRTCFQNGMGAKQFSDALRIQHTQTYDELELQYLHALASRRGMSEWQEQTSDAFLPFCDNSSKGPNGFVPSSQWLRDIYDQFIEQHQDELNQHTALLSAEICALDHSHKVCVS